MQYPFNFIKSILTEMLSSHRKNHRRYIRLVYHDSLLPDAVIGLWLDNTEENAEILMFYAMKRLQEHPTTTDIYIISSDSKDYDDAVPAPRTVEATSSFNANANTKPFFQQ